MSGKQHAGSFISLRTAVAALGFATVASLLVSIIVASTWETKQVPAQPLPPAHHEVYKLINEDDAISRLSRAVQFKTVSFDPDSKESFDTTEEFASLTTFLRESFPQSFATGVFIDVDHATRQPGSGKMHVLDWWTPSSSGAKWQHDPFSGAVDEEFIWGRGTLDDKVGVLAILEAMEALLAHGWKPRRTLYLSFGHDEEIGGSAGNLRIATYFKEKGIRFSFVLDEGGFVVTDALQAVESPVAVIGIAEKGYTSLKLTVEAFGGHSSMPPIPNTPVGVLAKALTRLEEAQLPVNLDAAAVLLDHIGPEMKWPTKLLVANRWLFSPIVKQVLLGSPQTAATVRTTIAPTIIAGGEKENVLPDTVSAVINFRILPGSSPQEVEEQVRAIISDDRVKITPYEVKSASSPSPYSGIDTREIFPDALVAPFVMVAMTDSRHFYVVSDNVYRFQPIRTSSKDLGRIHGVNERVSKENYRNSLHFFVQLLMNADDV